MFGKKKNNKEGASFEIENAPQVVSQEVQEKQNKRSFLIVLTVVSACFILGLFLFSGLRGNQEPVTSPEPIVDATPDDPAVVDPTLEPTPSDEVDPIVEVPELPEGVAGYSNNLLSLTMEYPDTLFVRDRVDQQILALRDNSISEEGFNIQETAITVPIPVITLESKTDANVVIDVLIAPNSVNLSDIDLSSRGIPLSEVTDVLQSEKPKQSSSPTETPKTNDETDETDLSKVKPSLEEVAGLSPFVRYDYGVLSDGFIKQYPFGVNTVVFVASAYAGVDLKYDLVELVDTLASSIKTTSTEKPELEVKDSGE